MSFDAISYKTGKLKGEQEGQSTIVLDSDTYDFVDENNDGHIVVTEREGNLSNG